MVTSVGKYLGKSAGSIVGNSLAVYRRIFVEFREDDRASLLHGKPAAARRPARLGLTRRQSATPKADICVHSRFPRSQCAFGNEVRNVEQRILYDEGKVAIGK